jgi:hypothetical protein
MMNETEMEPTNDGKRLVRNWDLDRREVDKIEAELAVAKESLAISHKALVDWLLPVEKRRDSHFMLPVGGGFVHVWYIGDEDIRVSWENRPRDLDAYVKFWK